MIKKLGINEEELDVDIANGDRARNRSPILKISGSGKFTSKDLEDHWKGFPYKPSKKRKCTPPLCTRTDPGPLQ